MSMPIASIHESVDLSNRFMVYIGLIALAAGSIIMYFAGKKITSPILSLAALSERMSELDFDARYTGDSEDEIGVLGNSMNTLSEKLKETIGELKTANNELQKDIEEKIRIDEARKEFIANVSHELKTPMTSMKVLADSLLEQENLPVEMYQEFMGDIAKEIDRDLAEKESGETFQEELADIEDSIEFESKETKSEDHIPDETANLSICEVSLRQLSVQKTKKRSRK